MNLSNLKLPFTPGRVFVVFPYSDPGYADFYRSFQEQFRDDSQFVVQPDVESALAAAVTNRNDVIMLNGNSTHNVAAMLNVSKSRIHFMGMDFDNRHFGQAAKIQLPVAVTGATNIGVMKNTGVRNSFKNIKFVSASTITESIYGVVEGGEYAVYENCEFYKGTDLDQTGAAELVLNGDSAQFKHCTIGSLADAIAGSSIIRAAVLLTAGLAGEGKVTRDSLFEDCLFWRQCKDTTNTFVYAANATDVERMLLFKGCGFINNKTASNLPAQAIKTGATLTVGQIILDPTCYGANVTKMSTSTGVIVTGAAPAAGQGIGVNAA